MLSRETMKNAKTGRRGVQNAKGYARAKRTWPVKIKRQLKASKRMPAIGRAFIFSILGGEASNA